MKLSQLFREQGKSSPTNISRGIFSLKTLQENIFPQKFRGEYFPQIPRWILWGNLINGYFCLQTQGASQIVFPKKRRVRGKRRENILRCYPKGENIPFLLPKGENIPLILPREENIPFREKIFPIEGKSLSLGNISSFGNIFLLCELFLFGENIHPVGNTLTREHF